MLEELKIVKYPFIAPTIDSTGNIDYDNTIFKECLKDCNGKKVSNDYFSMKCIGNDHYIVQGEFVEKVECDTRLLLKYGVICLQRDKNGNVIPMGEKLIVPFAYNRINKNNLDTLTASLDTGFTYIELISQSENYGKQFVPAILGHATPFSTEYEGFAECSVNGVVGYLPRSIKPMTQLKPEDLLSKEQVEFLISYLENYDIYDESIKSFLNLTGGVKTLEYSKKP